MRAPFILAAVLAVGANAAVIRRDDPSTTATTDITETITSIAAADVTVETTIATTTTEATETSTPTETETESETDSGDESDDDEDVELWESLLTDCSNSTIPRPDACVAQLWHTAGCIAPVPKDMLNTWANAEDSAALKVEMQGYYANATAADATQDAIDACRPVPKPIMVAVNCVHNVTTDMCKDCFSSTNFLGISLPSINATCVDTCLRDNADAFAEVCPNAATLVNCKDTLNSTCGQCVSQKPGDILGLPILDVDEDCFKGCYGENNQTIREACPLPAPIKSAIDCHQTLAAECSECVDDHHDIDVRCLDGCIQDKIMTNATLNETCPPQVLNGLNTIAEVIPSEDDIKEIFQKLLSEIQLPSFDLGGLLGGLLGGNGQEGGLDLSGILGGLLGGENGDGELMSVIQGFLGQLNNGENGGLQTVITNVLSQLGLGPKPAEASAAVESSTSTEEPTETEKTSN